MYTKGLYTRSVTLAAFIVTLVVVAGSAVPDAREPQPGGHFLNLDSFPLDRIVSGGPGKDGIPALTDPRSVKASSDQAAYLSDGDLVLGLQVNGVARAYPHNIGWWHEIVNDTIGGQHVIVSFCPLTGTGLAFDATGGDGGRIRAGVSGLLFNNNLIMYDRRDGRTLYPQMIFTGIQGPRAGESLTLMPVVETTWGYWKRLHPDTEVVSGDTFIYPRETYRHYPYRAQGDYRTTDSYILFSLTPGRDSNPSYAIHGAKDRVLGIRFGELAMAYPFEEMGDEAVINDAVAENPVLVVFYGAQKFAMPYSRDVDGRTLTFDRTLSDDSTYPFLLRDRETGSRWNLLGRAVAGELQGKTLSPIPGHNAFWFAWATFWQNTGIYERESVDSANTDFDGNGVVEFQDFLSFARRYGTMVSDADYDDRFDLSGNGQIDFADFLIFASEYTK